MSTQASIGQNPTEKNGEQSDRWVSAVLDLIKLTNKGKLTWQYRSDPSLQNTEYEASLGQKSIRLEANPLGDFEPASMFDVMGGHRSEPKIKARRHPYLRIYDSPTFLRVAFPDIAPLRALANAVESQVAGREYNILNEIHEAAEMT